MYWERKNLRKKPLNLRVQIGLLMLLLVGQLRLTQAQDDTSDENTEDDIKIGTESTADSIRFYLDDNERYKLLNVTCKSIKSKEHVCNSEHLCENLDPCTSYLSTLTIKKLEPKENLPMLIEKTIDVNTEYAEPETIMDEPISAQEFINITWRATNRACIKSFQIDAISVDKEFQYTFASDVSEKKIERLDPCQNYEIQLKTEDVEERITSNLTTTARTLYAEPENVGVTIVAYDEGQVKIMWEQPKYKTCISFYYLKWMRKDCTVPLNEINEVDYKEYETEDRLDSAEETTITPTISPPGFVEDNVCTWYANITDANAKEHVIGNLQGCEEYVFQMYININQTEKCEPQNFTAPEQVPGIVTLNPLKLNATIASISWNPPQNHQKCVHFYKVYITGPLQKATELQKSVEAATNTTVVTFDQLEPCGHYNYTILAISHNGTTGVSLNDTFYSTEGKPSAVRNYHVEEDAFNITVSWDPPNFADLCLNGYRLTVWRDERRPSFDMVTNDTSVTIDDLYSCQRYTVQIIPTTQSMDGELRLIETETKPIVSQAPNNFQAIRLYPGGVELSATEAGLNNKCDTIFARFTCELSKPADVIHKLAENYVEGEVGGITFKALLSPLSPYTEYRCNVALFNIAGWSANRTIIARTEPYFPDPPEHVSTKSFTNSSINFIWKAPKYANGNIKLYISHFQLLEPAYYIPPSCAAFGSEPIIRETSSLEQTFVNLKAFTKYSIQVAAQNEYGVGEYTMPYVIKTQPWIPEPIVNLQIVAHGPFASDADTEFKANATVSWTVPCRTNGDIEAFLLEFIGERAGHDRQKFDRIINPQFDDSGRVSYNETNLRPEFNYTVSVAVKTVGVTELGPRIADVFDAPAAIPKRLNETILIRTKVDAYEASNPTNSALVRFPADILYSESGTILYVALLLSEKNCNQGPILRYGALDTNRDWPDSLSWNEVHEDTTSNCIRQYQTTPLRWNPSPTDFAASRKELSTHNTDTIVYIIGTEKCDKTRKFYCNGPLKPDTEYYLIVRLFTKSGFKDAAVLEFKTDSLIELTTMLISIISCLLIAFIAGFIYLWITKRIVWYRESCHGIEDCFGDVMGKNFALFYRDVSKPEKLEREFKELTLVAMDLSYSASEIGYNKNRYADIFPYDKNRVILDIDAEGSDYINASFIDGYRRRKEYIATQGPKLESTLDFWRMILQYNVRVIVMVTQFREGEVVKCHEYFPYKSKTINAIIKKRDCFEIYDRTEISVTHDKYGLKQKVAHFYFKKWPDHGCPTDPMQLISFLRKVKAEKVPSYSPIVVHCSAGVGRTGTFIGLDIIMQRLRNESKINIYETVKKLRFQRMKMVQTIAQYTFLYSCTYELVKHKASRATLTYRKGTAKKANLQNDSQINVNTTQASNCVGNQRSQCNDNNNGSDPSPEVNELHDDLNGVQNCKNSLHYGNAIPLRFTGISKVSDLESLEEHDEDDHGGNNIESFT